MWRPSAADRARRNSSHEPFAAAGSTRRAGRRVRQPAVQTSLDLRRRPALRTSKTHWTHTLPVNLVPQQKWKKQFSDWFFEGTDLPVGRHVRTTRTTQWWKVMCLEGELWK